jgi:hypothetical protein
VTDVEGANVVVNGTFTTPDSKLFASVAQRNLHLRPDAPAIDRAGDISTGGSDKDVDLEPRKNGPATDMGADEFFNRAPRAAFTASTTSPKQNETVTFDASKSADPEGAYGGGITTYYWDFGDGQTTQTTTPTVTHAYPDVGSYHVRLAVADTLGAASNVAATDLTVTDGIPAEIKIAAPKSGQRFHVYRHVTTKKTVENADATKRTVTTRHRVRQGLSVRGTTTDANGVSNVEVSVRRIKLSSGSSKSKSKAKARAAAKQCVFLDPRKRQFTKRSCKKPLYFYVALKKGVFSFRTKKGTPLRAASYELAVRATDGSGLVSPPTTVRFRFIN